MTPRELAARAESAAPEQQRDLLEEAIECAPHLTPHARVRARTFVAMGAYVDTALMLVPEGMDWAAGTTVKGDAFANLDFHKAAYAATPALALLVAICRSKETADADT